MYLYTLFDNPQIEIINNTNRIINTGEQITLDWYLSSTTIDYCPNDTIRF